MSQSVPSKAGRGGRTKPQRVFAEQGVAMLSSVLQAPIAAKVNVKFDGDTGTIMDSARIAAN